MAKKPIFPQRPQHGPLRNGRAAFYAELLPKLFCCIIHAMETQAKPVRKPKTSAKKKAKRKTAVKPVTNPPVESRPVGRPSDYRPEYAEQAYKLCLLMGATDKQLAHFFEVSEQTINAWKKASPEFLESIKSGKVVADANVAHGLYRRATGAEFTTHQAFKVRKITYGENGKKKAEIEEVITVPVVTAVAPDTNAASLWLRNRASDTWKDRAEMTTLDDPLAEILAEMRKQSEEKT